MSEDDFRRGFEDLLRSIGDELSRSVDDIARYTGIDADQARTWVDGAGEWLREQTEAAGFRPEAESRPAPQPAGPLSGDHPLRGAAPHPLDLPTAEQGLALAALDSGRWSLEPGTSTFSVHGDGPGPRDALGLVRELRVRDWIREDGFLTVTGRRALVRWLDEGVKE